MVIKFKKGPYMGLTEKVVEIADERGIPVYITETGKRLSNNDLNKVFILLDDATIDFTSLGDPSLVENSIDYLAADSKNKDLKSINEIQKQEQDKIEARDKSFISSPKPAVEVDESEKIINGWFNMAKKANKKIAITFTASIPTPEFIKLITGAINIKDEVLFQKILESIPKEDIDKAILKQLKIYYGFENRPAKKSRSKYKDDNPKPNNSDEN